MSTALATRQDNSKVEEEIFGDPPTHEESPLGRADEQTRDEKARVRESFEQLADELEESAAPLSSTRRAVKTPAFLEILALGPDVLPLALDRLKASSNRPLWLRVLGTFTSSPPGLGKATVEEATAAWIAWGRHNF